jgi:NAD(P)-dependent dehydrogenase (short-subunit alcohol dehydrogenase family)
MSSVVLITGASTGFGREAAERLARRGHYVFATMRESAGRNAGHRLAIEQLAARAWATGDVLLTSASRLGIESRTRRLRDATEWRNTTN